MNPKSDWKPGDPDRRSKKYRMSDEAWHDHKAWSAGFFFGCIMTSFFLLIARYLSR